MSDCEHVTRMASLDVSETCATAQHVCVLCLVPQWSESWNLDLWPAEKRGAIVAKLRAEFSRAQPAQGELFTEAR